MSRLSMSSSHSNSSHTSLTVNEQTPLIDLPPSSIPLTKRQKYIFLALKVIVVVFTITLFVAALTVRGSATVADCVLLGLICAGILLFIAFPYAPSVNFDRFSPNTKFFARISSNRVSFFFLIGVLAIISIVTFALPTDANTSRLARAQSLLGLVVFLFLLWITSNNRKAIAWRTVWVGLLLQFLLALFVLRTWAGFHLFKWLSDTISAYLGYSAAGYLFLFGGVSANFAGSVFPAIIFFCATVELLYYFGALQAMIRKFATFFLYLMGTSGAESVVAAASPFIGQGENALLVRPFIADMTKSEIHQVMASGFATISGSVLYGYIALGVSPQYLITAAIMSVPCAISLSKMRYPEEEEAKTKGEVKEIPQDERHKANNPLQALGGGAKTGMKIVLIIAASLIAVLSLLAAVNAFLSWVGAFFSIANLSVQKILSYFFYPIAFLMGVTWHDIPDVAELLALKLAANEFAAYMALMEIKETLSARTVIIITYALCGFANFSSIGIQIGILGTLAPSRLGDFSHLAFSAMLTGALSTCFSAVLAGMLF